MSGRKKNYGLDKNIYRVLEKQVLSYLIKCRKMFSDNKPFTCMYNLSVDKNCGKLTDRVSTRVADEDLLKVRTANGQHDFVALQELTITGNCTIDKVTTIKETLKTR